MIAGAIFFGTQLFSSAAPAIAIPLHAQPGFTGSGLATPRHTDVGWSINLTVAHLKVLPPGQFYECWYAGPGNRPGHPNLITAGTFVVCQSGGGAFTMWSAADPAKFKIMQITAEQPGDAGQHGPVILSGSPKPPGVESRKRDDTPGGVGGSPDCPGRSPGGRLGWTYLYAVGGRKVTVTANTAAVQRFNPATGQWTQLPPMPSAASDLGAAIVGGQLITVGGESPASVFSTVRAYNLATSTWSTLPNLAAARHGAAVAAIGNTLYVINGASQPGHNTTTATLQTLRFGR